MLIFRPHLYMSNCPYTHKLGCHILNKILPKNVFAKGIQLYFEISLLSLIYEISLQNFYQHVAV